MPCEAVHLIKTSPLAADGAPTFAVCPTAAAELRQMAQHHSPGPLQVVCVLGTVKSGKSFLAHAVAQHPGTPFAGDDSGQQRVWQPVFPMGDGVEPTTRGVWAVARARHGGGTIVVLDIEGLHALSKPNRAHDAALFAIAMALASTLVYNVRQYPDRLALDELAAITPQARKLLEIVPTTASADADHVSAPPKPTMAVTSELPELHIVVRDFFLEDTDTQRWIDQLLAPPADVTVASFQGKALLRAAYPAARMTTLPHPVPAGSVAQLAALPAAGVEPRFVAGVAALAQALLAPSARTKSVAGVPLRDVDDFIDFATQAAAGLSTGRPIVLQDTLSNAVAVAQERAHRRAEGAFFSVVAAAGDLPLADDAVTVAAAAAADRAIEVFAEHGLFTSDEHAARALQAFVEHLDDLTEHLDEQNDEATDRAIARCVALHCDAIAAAERQHQDRPGGASEFAALYSTVAQDFTAACGDVCAGSACVVAQRASFVQWHAWSAQQRLATLHGATEEAAAAVRIAAEQAEAARRAVAAAALRETRAAVLMASEEERFADALEHLARDSAARTDALVRQQTTAADALATHVQESSRRQLTAFAGICERAAARDREFQEAVREQTQGVASFFQQQQRLAVQAAEAQARQCSAIMGGLAVLRRAELGDAVAEAGAAATIRVAELHRPDPVGDALLGTAAGIMGAFGDGLKAKIRQSAQASKTQQPQQHHHESTSPLPSAASAPVSQEQGLPDAPPPAAEKHGPVDCSGHRSFSEAFAAAHDAVGPGGAFSWQGRVFTTDRADGANMQGQGARVRPPPRAPVQPLPPHRQQQQHQMRQGQPTFESDAAVPSAPSPPPPVAGGPGAEGPAYGTSVEVSPETLDEQPSVGMTLLKEATGWADGERSVESFKKGDYFAGTVSAGCAVLNAIPVTKGLSLGYKGLRVGAAAFGRWIGKSAATKATAKQAASVAAAKQAQGPAKWAVVEGKANAYHDARYHAATLQEQLAKSGVPHLSAGDMSVRAAAKDLRPGTLSRLNREYGAGAWEKMSHCTKNAEGVARSEIHFYLDKGRNLLVEPKFKKVKFPSPPTPLKF